MIIPNRFNDAGRYRVLAMGTMIYGCDVCGKEFETFGECDERFALSPPCRIAGKWE